MLFSANVLRFLAHLAREYAHLALARRVLPPSNVKWRVLAFVLLLSLLVPASARADVRGVVGGSFRTVGCVFRDGAWTVGRTVRSLFKQGPDAAGRTAQTNGRRLKANARQNASRVRAAAR
jgi:hypothetical protein